MQRTRVRVKYLRASLTSTPCRCGTLRLRSDSFKRICLPIWLLAELGMFGHTEPYDIVKWGVGTLLSFGRIIGLGIPISTYFGTDGVCYLQATA